MQGFFVFASLLSWPLATALNSPPAEADLDGQKRLLRREAASPDAQADAEINSIEQATKNETVTMMGTTSATATASDSLATDPTSDLTAAAPADQTSSDPLHLTTVETGGATASASDSAAIGSAPTSTNTAVSDSTATVSDPTSAANTPAATSSNAAPAAQTSDTAPTATMSDLTAAASPVAQTSTSAAVAPTAQASSAATPTVVTSDLAATATTAAAATAPDTVASATTSDNLVKATTPATSAAAPAAGASVTTAVNTVTSYGTAADPTGTSDPLHLTKLKTGKGRASASDSAAISSAPIQRPATDLTSEDAATNQKNADAVNEAAQETQDLKKEAVEANNEKAQAKAEEHTAQKKADAAEGVTPNAQPQVAPNASANETADANASANETADDVGDQRDVQGPKTDAALAAQRFTKANEGVLKAKVTKEKADQAQHEAQRQSATEWHEKTRKALNDAATQKTSEAKVKRDLEVTHAANQRGFSERKSKAPEGAEGDATRQAIHYEERASDEDRLKHLNHAETNAREEREVKRSRDRYNKNQNDDVKIWTNRKITNARETAKNMHANSERVAKSFRTNSAHEASATQATAKSYADVRWTQGMDEASRAAKKAGGIKVDVEKMVADHKSQGFEIMKKGQVAASETIAEAEKHAADLKSNALKLKTEKMKEVVEIGKLAKKESADILEAARKEAAKTDAPTMIPTKFPTPSPTNYPTLSPTQFPTNMPTDEPTLVKAHSVIILKNFIHGITYTELTKDKQILQGVKYSILTSTEDLFKVNLDMTGGTMPHIQIEMTDGLNRGVSVKITITPPPKVRSKDVATKLEVKATKEMFVNAIAKKITTVIGVGRTSTAAVAVTIPSITRVGEPDDADKDKFKMTTKEPTPAPTPKPTKSPTQSPTMSPMETPTPYPTYSPTEVPTKYPTRSPTKEPTKIPTEMAPCEKDDSEPVTNVTATEAPFCKCSKEGKQTNAAGKDFCWMADDHSPQTCTLYNGKVVRKMTWFTCVVNGQTMLKCPVAPTVRPTLEPTKEPTVGPTEEPTASPTNSPTATPTPSPTKSPTRSPTESPTQTPTPEATKFRPENKECTSQHGVHYSGHTRDQYVGEGPGSCIDGNKPIIIAGGETNFVSKCKDMCQNAQFCDKWSFWAEAHTGGHCYFFISAAPKKKGYHTYGGECTLKQGMVIASKSKEPTPEPTSTPTEPLDAQGRTPEQQVVAKEVEGCRQKEQDANKKHELQNAEQEMKAKVSAQKAEAAVAINKATELMNQAEAADAKAQAETKENQEKAAKTVKAASGPCPSS